MIYIEFIEREAGTPIEVFRHLGNQQSAWSEVATDQMILQLGRTLRLGPRPSYLCLWEIPDIGRLDAWEEYFRSSAAAENPRSQAMHRAINIQRAGLYDVLWQGETLDASLYLILYCEPGGATNEALINVYRRPIPINSSCCCAVSGKPGRIHLCWLSGEDQLMSRWSH
jgi:hypothetical protein